MESELGAALLKAIISDNSEECRESGARYMRAYLRAGEEKSKLIKAMWEAMDRQMKEKDHGE